jgi:NifB/MoaA-like Fe-S oxidoreductase
VWNEPSAGIALAEAQARALGGEEPRLPQPAVVAGVEPGSIGEELGFQPGDRLLSINGVRPRDLIDLQVLCCEEELVLEVEDPGGSHHVVELEKDADEGLGLAFT